MNTLVIQRREISTKLINKCPRKLKKKLKKQIKQAQLLEWYEQEFLPNFIQTTEDDGN